MGKRKQRKLNRAQTIETVDELGGILNTFSLGMLNNMSDQALRDLAIKKGSQSNNPLIKQICLNVSQAHDIVETIELLRERLGDALN